MKHWVFDLDNTLIDSFSIFKEDIQRVFQFHNVMIEPSQMHLAHRHHFMDFLNLFVPSEKVDIVARELIESSKSRAQDHVVYDGIFELLHYLQEKKCALSIWTAREMESAEILLNACGLKNFFSTVVTRSCVEQTKPHPEGLHRILKDCIYGREKMVMVGDHAMDMQGARSAGVLSIRAGWGVSSPQDELHLSDYHFTKVSDLKNWAHQAMENH